MRSVQKIIIEFAGVFLIGALVGGLIVYEFTGEELTSWMSRINDPDSMVKRIDKKYRETYHLSDAEMERITPLIKEMAQHIYQVRHQFGVDIIAVGDNYHQQIADLMTPEHRAVYEAANADRKKKIGTMLQLDQSPDQPSQK